MGFWVQKFCPKQFWVGEFWVLGFCPKTDMSNFSLGGNCAKTCHHICYIALFFFIFRALCYFDFLLQSFNHWLAVNTTIDNIHFTQQMYMIIIWVFCSKLFFYRICELWTLDTSQVKHLKLKQTKLNTYVTCHVY